MYYSGHIYIYIESYYNPIAYVLIVDFLSMTYDIFINCYSLFYVLTFPTYKYHVALYFQTKLWDK